MKTTCLKLKTARSVERTSLSKLPYVLVLHLTSLSVAHGTNRRIWWNVQLANRWVALSSGITSWLGVWRRSTLFRTHVFTKPCSSDAKFCERRCGCIICLSVLPKLWFALGASEIRYFQMLPSVQLGSAENTVEGSLFCQEIIIIKTFYQVLFHISLNLQRIPLDTSEN